MIIIFHTPSFFFFFFFFFLSSFTRNQPLFNHLLQLLGGTESPLFDNLYTLCTRRVHQFASLQFTSIQMYFYVTHILCAFEQLCSGNAMLAANCRDNICRLQKKNISTLTHVAYSRLTCITVQRRCRDVRRTRRDHQYLRYRNKLKLKRFFF